MEEYNGMTSATRDMRLQKKTKRPWRIYALACKAGQVLIYTRAASVQKKPRDSPGYVTGIDRPSKSPPPGAAADKSRSKNMSDES